MKALNEAFICVKLDGEANAELASRYHVRTHCTFVFLDPEGEVVHIAEGFRPPAKFVEMLRAPAQDVKRYRELAEALAKTPDDPKVNFDYAVALFQRGKPEEAAAALDKVAALDPEDQAGLADDVDLVHVEQMMSNGAFADAEATLKAFLEKRPKSDLMPKAYLFLGLALVNQNKFDDGIATWKTGIEKFPNANESKHAQALIPRAESQKARLQKKQEPEGK